MKTKLLAAAAIAAAAFAATSASALTITTRGPATSAADVEFVPTGFSLITAFNSTGGTGADSKGGTINDLASGFTFTQGNAAKDYTRLGSGGLEAGSTAPPPFDDGYYETVQGGSHATLTDNDGYMTSFSFFMGSPDNFNHLSFTLVGIDGTTTTLNGKSIWGGTPAGNGDQSKGFTVMYNFDGLKVKTIEFASDSNSFEFDTLAAVSVPEPASWALMIVGFGAAGSLLRAQRRKAVVA